MFNPKQITSYQNILAPADLKERVFVACQNTNDTNAPPIKRILYQMAPLAACLVLCFTLLLPSLPSRQQPFYVMAGETVLDSYGTQLPPIPQEAAMLTRTISAEARPYSISLQTIPEAKVLFADGEASLDEDGSLVWTIHIPDDDMVFDLTLQAGNDTYQVTLSYYEQDGSFIICCYPN